MCNPVYLMYCTALYCPVLYCTVLYCTVLYCNVLYCTLLHCTVLYCTVLHYTVLYSYRSIWTVALVDRLLYTFYIANKREKLINVKENSRPTACDRMFTDRCLHEIRLNPPSSWNTKPSCPLPTPLTDWLNASIQQLAFIKSSNEWQLDGDDSSTHFTVTNCCNGTLCVAELVHSLFCALREELYVISRYLYVYIYS